MLGKFAAPPQNSIVTGIVSDEAGPLQGAIIKIKGKEAGAVTDIDGFYQIETIPGDTLEFHFLGFETQTKVVGADTINIKMEVTLTPEVLGDAFFYRRTFFGRIFHSIGDLFRNDD